MQPLADKIRPNKISLLAGQEHLLGKNGILTRIFESEQIPSLIFWGPTGCGKTSVAKLLAKKSGLHFEMLSATSSGAADLRKVFARAEENKKLGSGTMLLVDEIHCFRRNQQDLFLPYIEDGTIVLVGATTENPSFELNSALLSRCRLLVFKPLDTEALDLIAKKAEESEGKKLPLDDDAKQTLYAMCDGDGRYLLNMCEELFALKKTKKKLNTDELLKTLQKRSPIYDKSRDGHYGLISALHKSLRGSDVQAALYWTARMMLNGEHPHYILRRLVRFAIEDIGVADPNALVQANAAKEAYDFLGSPEGDLAITQAVVYLANAPKSNAQYVAHNAVYGDAKQTGSLDPPKHILNAPTIVMKNEGYGDGYIYDHNTKYCFSGQNYFPEKMNRKEYYKPNERGFERDIKKRMEYWDNLRKSFSKS
ncbi:replication-associated recombination protein A [Pseudomonadota bacterium]